LYTISIVSLTMPPSKSPDNTPQFSLSSLLLVVGVVGVLLGFLRNFGVFGLGPCFALAVGVDLLMKYLERNGEAPTNRMTHLMWGVVMPLICLVYDPTFFSFYGRLPRDPTDLSGIELHGGTLHFYCLVGSQILLMGVLVATTPRSTWLRAFLAGGCLAGATTATIIGLFLLLPSLYSLHVYGIGFAGFTPWFAAMAFYAQSHATMPTKEKYSTEQWLHSVGLLSFSLVPLVIGGMADYVWDTYFQ